MIGGVEKIKELGERVRKNISELEMLRELIQRSPYPFIEIDEQSRVLLWNEGAERLFGWTRAETVNLPLYEFLIPDRLRKQHQQGMQRFLTTRAEKILNRTVDMPALTKKGEEILIRLLVLAAGNGENKWRFAAFIQLIEDGRPAY